MAYVVVLAFFGAASLITVGMVDKHYPKKPKITKKKEKNPDKEYI